ncbi:MAG: hypothetical protein JXB26_20255 [Candidatus Aminicenantes bacterium]|nr:hypothetical protein [Candidatus Aminicenantes bacterium]
MAMPKQKRMNFFVPYSLYQEINEIISFSNISKSDFARDALREYIKKIKKQQLKEQLKESYLAKSKLNIKISKDFEYVDTENI